MWPFRKKNLVVVYLNVDGVTKIDIPAFVEEVKKASGSAFPGCYMYFVPIVTSKGCSRVQTYVEVHRLN